jgi:hypothetical protein
MDNEDQSCRVLIKNDSKNTLPITVMENQPIVCLREDFHSNAVYRVSHNTNKNGQPTYGELISSSTHLIYSALD